MSIYLDDGLWSVYCPDHDRDIAWNISDYDRALQIAEGHERDNHLPLFPEEWS